MQNDLVGHRTLKIEPPAHRPGRPQNGINLFDIKRHESSSSGVGEHVRGTAWTPARIKTDDGGRLRPGPIRLSQFRQTSHHEVAAIIEHVQHRPWPDAPIAVPEKPNTSAGTTTPAAQSAGWFTKCPAVNSRAVAPLAAVKPRQAILIRCHRLKRPCKNPRKRVLPGTAAQPPATRSPTIPPAATASAEPTAATTERSRIQLPLPQQGQTSRPCERRRSASRPVPQRGLSLPATCLTYVSTRPASRHSYCAEDGPTSP